MQCNADVLSSEEELRDVLRRSAWSQEYADLGAAACRGEASYSFVGTWVATDADGGAGVLDSVVGARYVYWVRVVCLAPDCAHQCRAVHCKPLLLIALLCCYILA